MTTLIDKDEKKEALRLLMDLERAQGEHNGRWEDELNIEDSSLQYFEDVTSIADEIGMEYAKGDSLEFELMQYETDGFCVNKYDAWTFALFEKIEEYLVDIILRGYHV